MNRVYILVTGVVQGVGFRHAACKKAEELGLTGWVRNTQNGKVEILAEGSKEALKKLVNWSKKGSYLSEVKDLEVSWEEYSGEFSSFMRK